METRWGLRLFTGLIDRLGTALSPVVVRRVPPNFDKDYDPVNPDWVVTYSLFTRRRRWIRTYGVGLNMTGRKLPDLERLSCSDIRAGDLLLFVPKKSPLDHWGYVIQVATRGAFSHVAVASYHENIFEAYLGGVRKRSISSCILGCEYIVVLRPPYFAQSDTAEALDRFLQQAIGKYDIREALRVPFYGTPPYTRRDNRRASKQAYICSGFVAAALEAVGYSHGARMQIVPSDFLADGYGLVLGFLSSGEQVDFHPWDISRSMIYPDTG